MSEIETVDAPARIIAGLRDSVAADDLDAFFDRAMPAVATQLATAGIAPLGPPVAVYRRHGGDVFDVTVGFPVNQAVPGGALITESLPAGRTAQAVHVGPYDTLSVTYERLTEWTRSHGFALPATMWEEYLVGPATTGNPAGWRTRVAFPLM